MFLSIGPRWKISIVLLLNFRQNFVDEFCCCYGYESELFDKLSSQKEKHKFEWNEIGEKDIDFFAI